MHYLNDEQRDNQEKHKLLLRQLKHLGLKRDSLPKDLNAWEAFLDRVSKAYLENDQDRYTLERSMNVSSQELEELNKKLQKAQEIAGLGYWQYDRLNDRVICSHDLYELMGLADKSLSSSLSDFLSIFQEEDREDFENLIKNALSKQKDFQTEKRIAVEGDEKWFYISAHPASETNTCPLVLDGIALDITARKIAESEMEYLNEQLILTARQAGMADIATSILHNVGNILNSAIVSSVVVQEQASQSAFTKLMQLIKMIKDHAKDPLKYLTEDPKGKLIPQYLAGHSESFSESHEIILEEAENLEKSLQHVRDIISTQNSVSKVSDQAEYASIPELIDTAIKMTGHTKKHEKIEILREDNFNEKILVNKSKFLQVLINLIENAKDSIIAANREKRVIKISVDHEKNCNRVKLSIKDNGTGIPEENMKSLFSFGYTTKEKGHGFGLHASALAAKEMKGYFDVENNKDQPGACFILNIPKNCNEPLMGFEEKSRVG